jgi:ABC-type nickel/cobalt efflux system permease component RcnA
MVLLDLLRYPRALIVLHLLILCSLVEWWLAVVYCFPIGLFKMLWLI